jgi:hypothetical protein
MLKLRNRRVLLGAVLFALIVRAMIPAGFMPAADFSFQICPDGYPAHLLQAASPVATSVADDPHAGHHDRATGADSFGDAGLATAPIAGHDSFAAGHAGHSDGTHRHASAGTEHCAFAAVASAGPSGWSATFCAPATIAGAPEFIYSSPAITPLRFRVPQPRGPPALS